MGQVGHLAEVACVWEATARKPGNVHRHRDFDDASYLDFLVSAGAIRPVLNRAGSQPVGTTVLQAVEATREVVATNTNLGIILLLAPLVAVPAEQELSTAALLAVLQGLTVDDSRAVYKAIRLARPAGLGRVEGQDIAAEPTLPLGEIMALAADRDLIARQYANGFREVFAEAVPAIRRGIEAAGCLESAIIACHLTLLAAHPDSLIARKRGLAEAEEASRRARAVLDAGWPEPAATGALNELDNWLCSAARGRNPGTTADLVAAALFVALRRGLLSLPPVYPWSLTGPGEQAVDLLGY
jgi:triphosphoribosyl-dephospho-CoA synthase